jgi:hypothetical protein
VSAHAAAQKRKTSRPRSAIASDGGAHDVQRCSAAPRIAATQPRFRVARGGAARHAPKLAQG